MGLAFALLGAPSALANGRYPAADQIVLDPDDPDHLLLRATFGLLDSRDQGLTWSWICEAAAGFTGDPALAVFRGGGVLAGTFGSVSTSSDGGCGWTRLELDTSYRYPFDATLDPAEPERAWLVAASVDGSRSVRLLAVGANGALEAALPIGAGFVPTTLEIAPSKPDRIYVTGIVENAATIVLRSDDRGLTWQQHEVPGYGALPLFISAIDPNDPDVVYARIDGRGAAFAQPGAASDELSDHLLVTRDGGATWFTILSLQADMLGFALSPDGSRIAVGGPGSGLFVADTGDLSFRPAAAVRVLRCLRWTRDALFACAQESLDGWTIGRSLDGGDHFEPLWHQQDLAPLECAATSRTGQECPRAWPDIARSISAGGALPVAAEADASASRSKADGPAGCSVDARAPGHDARWSGLALVLISVVRRRLGLRGRCKFWSRP